VRSTAALVDTEIREKKKESPQLKNKTVFGVTRPGSLPDRNDQP